MRLNIYQNIKQFAIKHASKETTFSGFIVFLFGIFTNEFTDVIITIISTLILGGMYAKKYFGKWFIISAIIYCILLLFSAIAKKYYREKLFESKMNRQALMGISEVLRAWSVCLQKCARSIAASNKTKNEIKLALRNANFQSVAFTVCEKLHTNLTKYCESEDVYITIYQKYKIKNKSFCKMIAYSINNEPATFNEEYLIPMSSEGQLGKVPYHSYLFSLNSTNIDVLSTSDAINDKFIIHEKNRSREECLQQYIAIPIAPAKQGVIFLLQIDTCKEKLFGNNKNEVERFIQTAIYPYAQFLHMIYEESRVLEQLQGRIY